MTSKLGWANLVIIGAASCYFFLMGLSAKDAGTAFGYYGISGTLLVLLVQQLDSLGLFGPKENARAALEKKLQEVYSPIHAMIHHVNKYMPADQARQMAVGNFVPAAIITNLMEVGRIFHEHAHDLGNHNLDKWIDLEREIVRGQPGVTGFFLGQKWQAWFDELEAEYDRLVRELGKLK